jgi:hypothetical protein
MTRSGARKNRTNPHDAHALITGLLETRSVDLNRALKWITRSLKKLD